MSDTITRPVTGTVEERTAPHAAAPTVEGRRLHGLVPTGVQSRDLGGWSEVIDPGALDGADMSDLVATVDHAGVPIGRHPSTLTVENTPQGLRWSVELPESRADVREAVERGDLRSTSFRFVAAADRWDGDVRHVTRISELRDVSIVTTGAYPTAAAEYRSAEQTPEATPEAAPIIEAEEATMPDTQTPVEDRDAPTTGLSAADRTIAPTRRRGLADEFRHAGFPGETATIPWTEFESRAVTWAGSLDTLNRVRTDSAALGFDQRYAWPAFARIGVEAGVTSVDVVSQTARTLPTPANVVRAIDATTNKPEVASTLTVTALPLKQVAAVQSGVPNVYLESVAVNTIVEADLRLALNEGLDKLVLDAIAGSGFQPAGTDNILVSIRKAITAISAAGYNADTVILTPAAAEAIDVLVSGISGGTADFVNGAGNYGPATIFGLNRRISKTIPATAVADSTALGKMYASPVTLARFEESSGRSNTSLIRLEGHAVFGTERQGAAVRIAAS